MLFVLFSLSQQAAYKQKVPPWYAVLWEAWRILVLQKYGFYLIPPNIFFKICLPNMDFNAASQRLVRFSLPAQLFSLFKSRFSIFKVFRYA